MLSEILLFFKRERLYLLLLLFVGVFYALMISMSLRPNRSGPVSPRGAPAPVAADVPSAGVTAYGAVNEKQVADFFRENPVQALLFNIMTLCFILGAGVGAVLDVLFLMRPAWRSKFTSGAPPPQTRSWPFSLLFKTVLLFMVWGILLSFVLGFASAFLPRSGTENLFMILHTFILDVLCVFFMVRFLGQQGSSWRELGFRAPEKGVMHEVKAGFLAYLGVLPVFFIVLIVLIAIVNLMGVTPPPHPLVNVFIEEEKRQPLLVIFSAFLGMVIGPVIEEVFFRGFCYPILKERIGRFWAMAVSSAFFAGIHHSGFVFWPVFVLGFALAYLYDARKNLISPIVLHITHNTVFICYFFLIKQVMGGS